MAAKARSETGFLTPLGRLASAPYAFSFYRALRLLECAEPDKPRIGTSKRLKDDPLRLAQEPSMAFAPSTIRALELPSDGRRMIRSDCLKNPRWPLHLRLFVPWNCRVMVDRRACRSASWGCSARTVRFPCI